MNYAIDQIGLAMAYSFVDMAIIGALTWIALGVTKNFAPAVRYWIALAGLAASIVPFAAQFTGGQAQTGTAVKLEWPAALASAWIVGVIIFSLRFLGGWVVLQRRINAAKIVDLPGWPELCARIGLRTPATLKSSEHADSPFAARIWRPVVVVPAATLAGLPADQLEAILLHELAHIRRADYTVELAQRLVETIFFYHPAIWLLSAALRVEREKACDDAAILAGADPAAFARALVTIEELRAPQLALAASSSSVPARVRRLLGQDRKGQSLGPLLAALIILAVPALSQITPYTKWLSEDVVYIIEAPEKATFERLRSDPEREKFIEQFWQRRGEAASSVAASGSATATCGRSRRERRKRERRARRRQSARFERSPVSRSGSSRISTPSPTRSSARVSASRRPCTTTSWKLSVAASSSTTRSSTSCAGCAWTRRFASSISRPRAGSSSAPTTP